MSQAKSGSPMDISVPLRYRPQIQKIGYSVHERKKTETFTMAGVWGVHVYFWEGKVEFWGADHAIFPNAVGITPPDTPLTWHFARGRCEHDYAHLGLRGDGKMAWKACPRMLSS